MRFANLVIVLLLLALGVAPGRAEKRVALVVGNATYRHADPLANPLNDARKVRDALTKLGFDVIFGEDLDQTALRRAIGQFAGVVERADVAIVYFAGHGATFADRPYVVPVDAEFSSLEKVPYELLPVETLIGELRRAKGVRIAILDACRDNTAEQELKRRATARGGEETRGLAPIKNPDGLIVAYATQHLSTAADSAGGANSPFTAALLNNIATPGLDVKELFFKVGRDVVAATEGKQRPEISISIYEQYALVPTVVKPAASAPPGGSPPVAAALPDAPQAPTPRPPTPAAQAPPSSVPARRLRYGYADTATGALVEVVVGLADYEVFNGILSALGAHALGDSEGQPTMQLTIGRVAVKVNDSGVFADCLNTQTVELTYSLRPLNVPPPGVQPDHVSRGRSCLERQPDGFTAKQLAIKQAVADLRSHLTAGP